MTNSSDNPVPRFLWLVQEFGVQLKGQLTNLGISFKS